MVRIQQFALGILALSAFCLAAVPASMAAAIEPHEIVQLVKSDVQDSIIINMVKNNKLPQPLGTGDVLALSEGGASQQLLLFLTSADAVVPDRLEGYPATLMGGEAIIEEPRVISSTVVGTSEYPLPGIPIQGSQPEGIAYTDGTVYAQPGTSGYYDTNGYYATVPQTVVTSPGYYVDSEYYGTPYPYADYYDYSYPNYYGGGYYFGNSWRDRPGRPSYRPPSHRPGGPSRPGRPGGSRPPGNRPPTGQVRPPSGGSRPPQGSVRPGRPDRDKGRPGSSRSGSGEREKRNRR